MPLCYNTNSGKITSLLTKEGRKKVFYLTTHSTHFYLRLYGVRHMVKQFEDITFLLPNLQNWQSSITFICQIYLTTYATTSTHSPADPATSTHSPADAATSTHSPADAATSTHTPADAAT